MIMGLPNRLKKLRTNFRLSQRDVAKILEISPSIVSAYETGERTPSVEILLKLSELYKCSTDYLLGKTEELPPTTINISDLTDAQFQVVLSVIRAFRAENDILSHFNLRIP